MHQPLALRRNFAWTFVANIIYAACQWAMLIVLAKLGGPGIIGIYSLSVALVAPVTIFGRINLRTIFVTDVKNKYLFSEYLTVRLATTILTLIVIAAITLLNYDDPRFISITLIIALSYCTLSVKEIFHTVMQKAERMDCVAISKVIQGIVSLVLFALSIYYFKSLLMGVLGLLVARSMVLFIYDIPRSEKIRPVVCNDPGPMLRKPRHLKELFKLVWLSFPVGITLTLISFHSAIPRYFIKYYYDEAYLGYFSAMSALLILGSMVVQALGNSACPRLAKYYVENTRAYFRLVSKLVFVGFATGCAGMVISTLFGKFFLTIFFTADYAKYHKELNWIVFCGAFSFVISLLGYSLSAARYFKTQAAIWTGIVTITTMLCALLVPDYGMVGAVWSMAIALSIGGAAIFSIAYFTVRKKASLPIRNDSCDLNRS